MEGGGVVAGQRARSGTFRSATLPRAPVADMRSTSIAEGVGDHAVVTRQRGLGSKRGREAGHADSALSLMLFPPFSGIEVGGRSRFHRLNTPAVDRDLG